MADSKPGLLNQAYPISLYVHVPFCRSKCPYCDFFSQAGASRTEMARVVEETLRELEFFLRRLSRTSVCTIYIGGGTPSLLPSKLFSHLVEGIRERCAGSCQEWSVETNPESLSAEFLEACAGAGVNRLSLGVQTLQEGLLRLLGRPGGLEETTAALERIGAAWKGRLNLDLLAGIPGQSRADLRRDIEGVLACLPAHVSFYCLSPPAGSPLAGKIEPERQEALWLEGLRLLEERGYLGYEVSNFCLPGQECLHNLRYWTLDPYLGVGPGAVSTLPGEDGEILRFSNPEHLDAFLQGEPGNWGLQRERIGAREFLFETLMMGLRLRRGIPRQVFISRFGEPLEEMVPGLWEHWVSTGLAPREEGEAYALSPAGRLILDALLRELQERLDGVDPPQARWMGSGSVELPPGIPAGGES